jgi:hypothetical protein
MAIEKAAKKTSTNGSDSRRPKVIEAADASRIVRVAYMTAVLGKDASEESLKQLSPEARIANAIIGQKTRDRAGREAAIKFRKWAARNAGLGVVKTETAKEAPLGKKAS